MAFKTMRISFDLPMEQLMGMIVASGADMHVDVFTDPKHASAARLNGHAAKALPAPKKRRKGKALDRQSVRGAMLLHVAGKPTAHVSEFAEIALSKGNATSAAAGGVHALLGRGLIKRTGPGQYKITTKGKAAAQQVANG